MEHFDVVTGPVAALDRANVDTDQIIPKQFLKRIERTGFGEFLFFDWRKDPAFELNQPEAQGARILITGRNFGCGSSREHAPWALEDYGFEAIVAPSYGDIFRQNSLKIGLLPVELPADQVKELMERAHAGEEITVDLEARTAGGFPFELDDFSRRCLLEGLDDVALTLRDEAPLAGDETVLDAGCGTGRVTQLLLERLPRGRVIAVDAAPSMVEAAREALDGRATVIESDLVELELDEPVDAAFSNAVFHWVPDHERLFARLHAALRPGALLVAQCGGRGNIARFHALAGEVAAEPPFAEHLGGWVGPWNFADAEITAGRLAAAGFVDVETSLEDWPVEPAEPREYMRTVCLGPHVDRLPAELREAYLDAVAERAGPRLRLEYVRLNILARRA